MPGFILQARRRPPAEDGPAAASTNGKERDVRIGFTVSRKVGNAVRRNRVKRRLRSVARTVLPQAGRPGYDYVLIGRRDTAERDFADLLGDLNRLFAGQGADLDELSEGLALEQLGHRVADALCTAKVEYLKDVWV